MCPDDMTARIRLVARHDFAQAPRRCHHPIDQPFAGAAAKAVADDDSRDVTRLPDRTRWHRMEIDQDRMTEANPRRDQRLGECSTEDRRVGKEGYRTCRSRGAQTHYKNKNNNNE